jgi:hypothetical protein
MLKKTSDSTSFLQRLASASNRPEASAVSPVSGHDSKSFGLSPYSTRGFLPPKKAIAGGFSKKMPGKWLEKTKPLILQ